MKTQQEHENCGFDGNGNPNLKLKADCRRLMSEKLINARFFSLNHRGSSRIHFTFFFMNLENDLLDVFVNIFQKIRNYECTSINIFELLK